jgi:hypothetical protein
MKIITLLLYLVLVIPVTPAIAAEGSLVWVRTCAGWNMWNSDTAPERYAFILGWLMASETADDRLYVTTLGVMWPRGWRVGGMVVDVNVRCRYPENQNVGLEEIILKIVKEKGR